MARAFAGSLCRYFAGARGEAVTFVAGVEAWRRDLAHALGKNLKASLDWREDPDLPVCTRDLGDAGWMALKLFAFYADRSDLELPDTVPALLELDRDYRTEQDGKFQKSRYGQLLACRVWLPIELPFTARVPLPDGESAEIGSLPVLRDQLRWLNQRTFGADEDVVATWAQLPAMPGGELLAASQRGFAGLWAVVQDGIARRLPVVVDEV